MAANWTDRRSGPVGCVTGQVAIETVEARFGELRKVRGTVFANDKIVVIGRTAQETYCRAANSNCAHWANVSRRQLDSLEAEFDQHDIYFMLVSLSADQNSIHTWLLPSRFVRDEVLDETQAKGGDQHDLKVFSEDRGWSLGRADVSPHYERLTPSTGVREELAQALRQEREIAAGRVRQNEEENPVHAETEAPGRKAQHPVRIAIDYQGLRIRLRGFVAFPGEQ